MTSRGPIQCMLCSRWISPLVLPDHSGRVQVCTAYPDGIPPAIWWHEADHRQSYPGDGGLLWEPDGSGREFPERSFRQYLD